MSYKLIGSINAFNTVPSVVYVVFLGSDGKLYIGYDDENSIKGLGFYDEFQQITEEAINDIKFISSTENIYENIDKEYKIGDLVICGYEYEEGKVYFGRLDNYLEFLKENEYDEPKEIKWIEPVVNNLKVKDPFEVDILNFVVDVKFNEEGIKQINEYYRKKGVNYTGRTLYSLGELIEIFGKEEKLRNYIEDAKDIGYSYSISDYKNMFPSQEEQINKMLNMGKNKK